MFEVFAKSFKEYDYKMVVLIICSTINNLIIVYIVKFFKLFEGLFLYTINDLLMIISYKENFEELFVEPTFYLLFIPKYIFFLIYLEVIRLKFLNLDKDAKETIEERAVIEMESILIDYENDYDDDEIEESNRISETSKGQDSIIYRKP